jgi:flagellar biosynthesis protein FlhG
MSRIITITSGKGGVGKTNISVNLALYLAEEGYRTCLFDADMGLANVDILLGLYPELSLEDVILDKRPLKDIIIKNYMGVDIVPGSSGIERMADPKPEELDFLVKALSELEEYDFLLIDTSAGISKNVVSFCMASSEIILVVTPEPTSLTDAYALLKILSLNGFKNSVMVAVNQCRSIEVSSLVFSKFKAAVEKYLPVKILPVGTILSDDHVSDAVKKQKPFISLFPNTNAAKGIKNIGRHLLKKDKSEFSEYGINAFWSRCLGLFSEPLQLSAPKPVKEKMDSEKTVTAKPEISRPAPVKPDVPMVEPEQEQTGSNVPEEAAPQPEMPVTVQEEAKTESRPQDLNLMLEKLVQGVSNISTELSAIRGILEKNYTRDGEGAKSGKSVIYR